LLPQDSKGRTRQKLPAAAGFCLAGSDPGRRARNQTIDISQEFIWHGDCDTAAIGIAPELRPRDG
jgi:hypothetical protein